MLLCTRRYNLKADIALIDAPTINGRDHHETGDENPEHEGRTVLVGGQKGPQGLNAIVRDDRVAGIDKADPHSDLWIRGGENGD